VVYRNELGTPEHEVCFPWVASSDKRPHGFGRVLRRRAVSNHDAGKRSASKGRPLRLERGKGCKALPIATSKANDHGWRQLLE